MNVMDLVAKISLDSQDFDSGLKESESSFSNFGSKLASGAKTVGKVAAGAMAAVGTAVVGTTAAFISNAKEVGAYADNIQKSAQKMQMTTDQYQEWSFIMEHSGSSIESVRGAMIKLGKAAEGNSEAFAKLGINQQEFQQMSSADQFEAAVKALQGVSDETERAALAEEMFGKSYMEMLPLLNTSVEETEAMKQQVHDLGGVMSEDAVNAGAQFQDSLMNMQTALSGLKNNMMGEFLPSLSTMMDGMASIFSGDESGIGKIQEGITNFASKINEILPQVIQTVSGIAEALLSALPQFADTLAQQLPVILEKAIPIVIDVLVKLSDTIVATLPKIIEAIEKNITTITSGLSKIILSIGQIIVKLFPKVFPMLIKVGIQLIKELTKGITENMDVIIKGIIEVVQVVVEELTNPDTLMTLLDCGLQLLMALIQGIIENLPQLIECMFTLLGNIVQFLLIEAPPKILETALSLFLNIGQGALDAVSDILGDIGSVLTSILGEDGIGGWASDILGLALGVFKNIGQGLKDAFDAVGDGIWTVIGTVGGWIKDRFYEALDWIHDVGEWLGKRLGEAFNIAKKYIVGPLKSLGDYIGSTFYDLTHDTPDPISDEDWNAMSASYVGGVSAWGKKGENDGKDYASGVEKSLDIHSPSKRFRWIGQMTMDGFSEGLDDEADDAINVMDKTIKKMDFSDMVADVSVSKNKDTSDPMMARLNTLERMMQQIAQMGFNVTIPVSVGNREIDEIYVDSKQRLQVRSGGQVDG